MYQQKFQNKLGKEIYQDIEQEFSNILVHDYYPNVKLITETFETARDLNNQFDLSFISSGITACRTQLNRVQIQDWWIFWFNPGHQSKFQIKNRSLRYDRSKKLSVTGNIYRRRAGRYENCQNNLNILRLGYLPTMHPRSWLRRART